MTTVTPAPPGRTIDFWVAPDGDDRWSGRLKAPRQGDGPFRTLRAARDAVRRLRGLGKLDRPVRITLRGGFYPLSRPLLLGPEDSGTTACPVTWRAAPGEQPVISGGRRIEGFREEKLNGRKVWVADLPQVQAGKWRFRQLFVNGVRAESTRLPKRGFYRIAGRPNGNSNDDWGRRHDQQFFYHGDDLRPWHNLTDVEVITVAKWVDSRLPIAALDSARRLVTFDRPAIFGIVQDYWVENVFEALDTPGQFYLDRAAGRLYYLPHKGEHIETAEVIAPVLPALLTLRGRRGQKIEHLRFEGLTFAHVEWDLPPGVSGWPQAAQGVPAAVTLTHARDCRFDRCAVEHCGIYAVEVERGCERVALHHCRLTDLGAGGVILRRGSRATTVADCEIGPGGLLFPEAVGVLLQDSSDNRIVHNHLHDLLYTGISCGWTWGYAPAHCSHNLLEYNHIHHIGRDVLSDMAGIYTLGRSPGTRVRYNLIHDVVDREYGGWGIYLDEGTSGILVERNVVYRCNSNPFNQHYGRDNLVQNNIFALGRQCQISRGEIEAHRSLTFRRNLVYGGPTEIFGYAMNEQNVELDHNLYWSTSGSPTFAGRSFEEWQALGQDTGSVVADPLFVDPQGDDFALREGSPAAQVGFKPIDLSHVGPRK